MYRSAGRNLLLVSKSSLAPARTVAGRRFASTEPAHLRSRSWKGSALRWGIAIAGIYYYNTSPVFAEQPTAHLLNSNTDTVDQGHSSDSVDALISKKQSRDRRHASVLSSAADAATTPSSPAADSSDSYPTSDPSSLEEEAEAQGAFNEETGEINWDCPCLGGMAHGPCGPEFREAFSCFVFSKEEPKGMDCIEKFKGMQECFQRYPEVYKGELEEDEEIEAEVEKESQQLAQQIAQREASERSAHPVEAAQKAQAEDAAPSPTPKPPEPTKKAKDEQTPPVLSSPKIETSSEPHPGMSEEHEAVNEGQRSILLRQHRPSAAQEASNEGDLMPKAWHDARDESGKGQETQKS